MYLDKIVIVVITNSLEINCKTLILKTKYKGFFMFRSKGVVIGFWLIPVVPICHSVRCGLFFKSSWGPQKLGRIM